LSQNGGRCRSYRLLCAAVDLSSNRSQSPTVAVVVVAVSRQLQRLRPAPAPRGDICRTSNERQSNVVVNDNDNDTAPDIIERSPGGTPMQLGVRHARRVRSVSLSISRRQLAGSAAAVSDRRRTEQCRINESRRHHFKRAHGQQRHQQQQRGVLAYRSIATTHGALFTLCPE